VDRELRRIVFTGPEQAEVETVPFDPSLEPDMALLRTRWSLLSPGTELAVYTDRHDIGHGSGKRFPAYPGYAAVGVIEAVGSAVTNLSPGDRALAVTGHCSLAKFKPAQTFCLRLPDDIRDDHATFVRMALITLATLCQADIRAGEWLGVVGLGIVGNLGAQFGLQAGLNVVGVGRSSLRSDIAARCGIGPILGGEPDAIADQVKEITGGAGCRLVLDTSGTADGLLTAVALAADGGVISLVGVPWESDPTVAATSIMQPLFSRYLTLQGGWEWSLPLYARDSERRLPMLPPRHSIEQNARLALDLIRSGRVQVEPLITHRIAPEAIQDAYQGLLRQRNEVLGALIDWNEDH
jgi:threonine dehydrogenase-like Zn-dependent dehydrogenase